jgi:exopolyphosphatase / guanosine-5'-triphosphate,3'-diphosphate pyrophosphatase
MRVATVDIGTNSVLLLVAERLADGSLVAVEEHARITRLGEGVDRAHALLPQAIARTNGCLDDYAGIVGRLGVERVAVVGTSAMRDARGGDVVAAHVRDKFGVDLRIVSGEEEARLSFAGSLSGLGYRRASGDIVVFDVGGGSTEVVLGRLDESGTACETDYAQSFDVGSVRLTERHGLSDPPEEAQLAAVTRDAREAFAHVPPLITANEPIGIAGTMTTLAAVSLGLATYDGARVHGHRMGVTELRRVIERLAGMPLEQRRSVAGLAPGRADVIVAGGLVALALLERLGATVVRVSDRGVRWGLALGLGSP